MHTVQGKDRVGLQPCLMLSSAEVSAPPSRASPCNRPSARKGLIPHPQSELGYDSMFVELTQTLGFGCCAVDEMGHRIDELENSIGELMAQAGIEEDAEGTQPPGVGENAS
eukprot:scaffold69596_cov35-Tisochrysis_lutea.AAC.1